MSGIGEAILTVYVRSYSLWPARPVFSGGLITLQQIRACQPVFSAALTGYVEATRDDDARKNLVCPANRYPDAAADWIPLTLTAQRAEIIWATDPDLAAWMQQSRLNATCGMGDHQGDPLMTSALARLFTNIEPAINKLETLMARTGEGTAGSIRRPKPVLTPGRGTSTERPVQLGHGDLAGPPAA
jgi:hypothetical protein